MMATPETAGRDVPQDIGRRVLWTFLAAPAAQLVGSAFNIWYNLTLVRPMLTTAQADLFMAAINAYNLAIYPPALLLWFAVVCQLGQAARRLDPNANPRRWRRAQRRAINLPWWAVGIAGPAWFGTIPVLMLALHGAPGPVDPQISLHLPVSVIIAALIALTHAFFVVEILSQRLWYPLFFADDRPSETRGAVPLTLTRRGLAWAVSAVVCPIASLLLLILVSKPGEGGGWFPLSVGGLGIAFGFVSAWMLGRIVVEPVEALRRAAQRVGAGDLGPSAEVDLLRADEFGTLIEQFNDMVGDLRQKRRVEELLGRHVDPHVARLLLTRDEEIRGAEREITVLFTDIRNFTARCAASPPRDVVAMLNVFFEFMVARVEEHDGIVNQFAGDGFMAIFGAIEEGTSHADNAVAAGRAMLAALPEVNRRLAEAGLAPLAIGIGINSGPAIVGSIGAPRRSSYTAVGDMVNVTARIESLTKEAGRPLLFSQTTREAMRQPFPVEELPPQRVKGKDEAVRIYTLAEAESAAPSQEAAVTRR